MGRITVSWSVRGLIFAVCLWWVLCFVLVVMRMKREGSPIDPRKKVQVAK